MLCVGGSGYSTNRTVSSDPANPYCNYLTPFEWNSTLNFVTYYGRNPGVVWPDVVTSHPFSPFF